MGTDIHGVWQRHTKTGWQDIESSYEQSRHYQLFAVLADVRNGYGMAGITTGDVVKPISLPRGLPKDFIVDDLYHHPIVNLKHADPHRRKYIETEMNVWMGGHDHSWLTGKEMLEWYSTAPPVVQFGVLDRSVYESWDKKSRPNSYCSGVSGPSIVVINDTPPAKMARPDWTHIRCSWDTSLREELGYFFKEVQRLVEEHGEIRFVFGFDS